MEGRLAPGVSLRAGHALVVEDAGDVERRLSGLRHVKDAPDDLGRIGVRLQFGSLLGSILDHHPAVAEGSPAGHPEASRCSLPHTPGYLLGQDIGYPINTKRSGIRGRLGLTEGKPRGLSSRSRAGQSGRYSFRRPVLVGRSELSHNMPTRVAAPSSRRDERFAISALSRSREALIRI